MWLRIPVELLAFNQGTGTGTGDGGGSGGTGGTGAGGGTGTGGSDGKSGEGSVGSGDGEGSKPTVDVNSQEFKDAVKAATEGQIEDRLKRDRTRRESDVERQKAEAAAQALKDNQKFEELATTRETQLNAANAQLATITAERDDLTARLTAADEAIATILKSQTKDLPPHVTAAISKMTPADQLSYLAEHGESIRKAGTQAVPNHSGGSGGSGQGSGNGTGGTGSQTGQTLVGGYLQTMYGKPNQDKDGK